MDVFFCYCVGMVTHVLLETLLLPLYVCNKCWYINRQAVPTRCYDNVSSIASVPVISVLVDPASWIDASLAKLCKVKVLKLSLQSFNRFTINFTFRKKVSRLRLRTDSFTLWDKVLCLTMFIRFARETLITDRFALTERQL